MFKFLFTLLMVISACQKSQENQTKQIFADAKRETIYPGEAAYILLTPPSCGGFDLF